MTELEDRQLGLRLKLLDEYPERPTREDCVMWLDIARPQFAMRLVEYPWWHWRRWLLRWL